MCLVSLESSCQTSRFPGWPPIDFERDDKDGFAATESFLIDPLNRRTEILMLVRKVLLTLSLMFPVVSSGKAFAQTLTLDNIGFSNNALTVFADISGTQDVSNCTFKIRGSAKKSDLNSNGLGTLLYTFSPINYAQFPVAGGGASGFSTNILSRRPDGKVYFRAYLTCSAFAVKSNIQSLTIPPSPGLQKSPVGKFLSHAKKSIDSGV